MNLSKQLDHIYIYIYGAINNILPILNPISIFLFPDGYKPAYLAKCN